MSGLIGQFQVGSTQTATRLRARIAKGGAARLPAAGESLGRAKDGTALSGERPSAESRKARVRPAASLQRRRRTARPAATNGVGRSSEPLRESRLIANTRGPRRGAAEKRRTHMAENGKTDGAAAREMITFLIGAQEFCIDVMSVREIRVWTPATPVAHAPSFLCGVINLRGKRPADHRLRGAARPPADQAEHPTRHPGRPDPQSGDRPVGRGRVRDSDDRRGSHPADARGRLAVAKDFVSGFVAIDGRMISLIALDAILPRSERDAA